MAELPVVSDAEFCTAMQVFGLPIDEKSEENGREVVLFTKTANVTINNSGFVSNMLLIKALSRSV